MDHREVGKVWDENAERWTELVRRGCDLYRDYVNAPAFFAMLPSVKGLKGLDIGCGEGAASRRAAAEGAAMTGIDISAVFIKAARELEEQEPLGIEYEVASAVELPFQDGAFDFVIATMSLMDMAETEQAVREAGRVLRRGGFLQFSISHPCFATPKWEWVYDEDGQRTALKCGDYFRELNGRIEEWIFGATPEELKKTMPKFRIPVFTRPLSKWLNLLLEVGFVLERFAEPKADDETVKKFPSLADTHVIAYFLIVRCRKA